MCVWGKGGGGMRGVIWIAGAGSAAAVPHNSTNWVTNKAASSSYGAKDRCDLSGSSPSGHWPIGKCGDPTQPFCTN
jgi:hypothetical protein